MKFHIEDDSLTITLEGGEVFLALRRRLVIPRRAITQAAWVAHFVTPRRRLGWRFGTILPGYLFAGTFLGPDGRSFLYMHGAKGLFGDVTAEGVLDLELTDYPYRRVLTTIQDADMAEQIVAWARGV